MRRVLGTSGEGRDIGLFLYPAGGPAPFDSPASAHASGSALSTLLIGATHGDEKATTPLLLSFLARYLDTGHISSPVAVIPCLNPDGDARSIRYNSGGVDLNRNFPHNWRPAGSPGSEAPDGDSPGGSEPPGTAPLSEPEAAAIHAFILAWRPAKVISLHWALAELDGDGPQSTGLTQAMFAALSAGSPTPYRWRASDGPVAEPDPSGCPGSLGQWCGYGLAYPDGSRPAMVTLELPYDPSAIPRPRTLPADHWETVQSLWKKNPAGYLEAVAPGVHRALETACRFDMGTIPTAPPEGSSRSGSPR